MSIYTTPHRFPLKHFLPALFVLLGLGLATTSVAEENELFLFGNPLIRDMIEGDMRVLRLANNQGGLHLSTKSATRETGASYSSPVANNLVKEHGVHLSYRLTWK